MNIAIYDTITGRVARIVSCPYNYADIQCQPGEEFYLNCPREATHIVNNEPVTIAASPPTTGELLAKIRVTRNQRLTACDWTQMPDSPLTPEKRLKWATYRQDLRDFLGICDLVNPVWPVAPI